MENFVITSNDGAPLVNLDRQMVRWPTLEATSLGPSEIDARKRGVGGSDANIILSGQNGRLRRLWQEKRGEVVPEDLSCHLPVALGLWTEAFNRQWFERLTGKTVCRLGEVLTCKKRDWRRCTLDGFVVEPGAVWEAKHTNGFTKSEDVLDRYMPQLQHNMAVSGAEKAYLSVIFGNQKYEIVEVAADWIYQIELLEAEIDFWDCVQTGREPVPAPPPLSPMPVGVREVCLEGNNAWAAAAADWHQHREAAKLHSSAVTTIKSLVEEDVSKAFGHGIEARRNKAGAISIREFSE